MGRSVRRGRSSRIIHSIYRLLESILLVRLLSRIFGWIKAIRSRRRGEVAAHRRRPLCFEPLEPRILLNADLVGLIGAVSSLVEHSDKTQIDFVVGNIGDTATHNASRVNLYATAGANPDTSTLVGTARVRSGIAAGGETHVPITIDWSAVPGAPAPG